MLNILVTKQFWDQINYLKVTSNLIFESETLVWNGQFFALCPCADSAPVSAEISTFQRMGDAEIDKLLAEFADIIDESYKPLAASTAVEAEIPTDPRPIRQRAYRAPLSKTKISYDQIDDMLNQGIITPSSSPWSSPVTSAPKKIITK